MCEAKCENEDLFEARVYRWVDTATTLKSTPTDVKILDEKANHDGSQGYLGPRFREGERGVRGLTYQHFSQLWAVC
jgi:hypothetical protein